LWHNYREWAHDDAKGDAFLVPEQVVHVSWSDGKTSALYHRLYIPQQTQKMLNRVQEFLNDTKKTISGTLEED